jgi:tellurite resistance protein
MTKEQIFAAFANDIAGADGALAREEGERIGVIASANKLDITAVIEAMKKEFVQPSSLKEIAKQMTDDDKDLVFFAAKRISIADGKIATKELKKMHFYCKLFGWGAQYVTLEYFNLLQETPSLKVEGVDF